MPNRFAFSLAGLIALAMIADYVLNAGEGMRFLVLKFLALLTWVEFWR